MRGKGDGSSTASAFPEDITDHVFHHCRDFVFGQEAGFDIDLGEFRLPVGTQVFVAKALGELIVAVIAGHHQKLLEELRRLRQREELAVVHAAGDQIVARAFRRALGQHRRFDVDEALFIEEAAEGHGCLVAQHHVLLHGRTTQIDHAMRQAHGFRQIVVVEWERRRD
jgi:hypothetical protein